ncbi:aconitate hydratase AcnA [Myxococcota bacterium]|nr:aconitate hydratase AcnA [Myxococcota bacterium]
MSSQRTHDPFGARTSFDTGAGTASLYRLGRLAEIGVAPSLERVPYSIRVLLESALRSCDGFQVTEDDVRKLAAWRADAAADVEIPFKPARVILQDFTGVPVLVDLAAMRSAVRRLGGDPARINPLVPVDLVIDHSVQVDEFASPVALARNAEIEFARNGERYEFLRWGQGAVRGFRAVPPSTGIVHQVNLEFLAPVVMTREVGGEVLAFPDSLVGTDSHTTMINGLGVVGWGVGGIEAEAVMLGQAMSMRMPEVVGFRLVGSARPGVTATDVVLTVTQILRKRGVVDKFVEFCGPGLPSMSLPDRATIANMAPEYGATMGFFPVDEETLRYLRRTARPEALVRLVERYTKEQGLFRTAESPEPEFTDLLELDLSTVEPSLAGPKRPQDRVPLRDLKGSFRGALSAPVKERGFGLASADLGRSAEVRRGGRASEVRHGSVVIAAITSCTNTSNPSVLMAAGLLARKAVARGLAVPPHVKTSLAPGSRVVTEYLKAAGLMGDLEALGFHVVGYGCTTCIGNSGPLPPEVAGAVKEAGIVASAVLSGNRNFEGRVHPLVKANYLASPPLVVAFALAGTTDIDLSRDPLGTDREGRPVFLEEIWPSSGEVSAAVEAAIRPDMFAETYAHAFDGDEAWSRIPTSSDEIYGWDEASTYIQEPPFFAGLTLDPPPVDAIRGARALAVLGDSVTTDHISPAGDIPEDSPAGRYLQSRGVRKADFNSYGSRRGNDRVMVRGTFANIRLKNLMVPGVEGGVTAHQPSGERASIFDAAERYRAEGVPLIVLAGKEYGTGSSRDWAAKGTLLLGVRAVIAESFERIHRSNLVGMGVLPLQFQEGQSVESLGLTGREAFDLPEVGGDLQPGQAITVRATREDGTSFEFGVKVRLDTPVDVHYYRNGGILHGVLRQLARG